MWQHSRRKFLSAGLAMALAGRRELWLLDLTSGVDERGPVIGFNDLWRGDYR